MPSRRQEQVNNVIKKTLGEIILEEIELPKDVLVTITRVDCSPSLENVYVYLSIFPDSAREQVLEILDKNTYHLQKLLDKGVVLKFVPKIKLQIDEGMLAENQMNEILDNLE